LTRRSASTASDAIRYAKFGEQNEVGSRRCTVTPASSILTARTKPSSVIGSSNSGSVTVASAARTSSTGDVIRVVMGPPGLD